MRCFALSHCPDGSVELFTDPGPLRVRWASLTGTLLDALTPISHTSGDGTYTLSVQTLSTPRATDPATRAAIIARVTSGELSRSAAARLYGVSPSRVSAWLRSAPT